MNDIKSQVHELSNEFELPITHLLGFRLVQKNESTMNVEKSCTEVKARRLTDNMAFDALALNARVRRERKSGVTNRFSVIPK